MKQKMLFMTALLCAMVQGAWAMTLLLCEINSAAIYDLSGKQVNEEPHTGVYIKSGKKVVK